MFPDGIQGDVHTDLDAILGQVNAVIQVEYVRAMAESPIRVR